jgi:hypothetical protein
LHSTPHGASFSRSNILVVLHHDCRNIRVSGRRKVAILPGNNIVRGGKCPLPK